MTWLQFYCVKIKKFDKFFWNFWKNGSIGLMNFCYFSISKYYNYLYNFCSRPISVNKTIRTPLVVSTYAEKNDQNWADLILYVKLDMILSEPIKSDFTRSWKWPDLIRSEWRYKIRSKQIRSYNNQIWKQMSSSDEFLYDPDLIIVTRTDVWIQKYVLYLRTI